MRCFRLPWKRGRYTRSLVCKMPKMVSHKVLAGKSYWQIFRYLLPVHLICKASHLTILGRIVDCIVLLRFQCSLQFIFIAFTSLTSHRIIYAAFSRSLSLRHAITGASVTSIDFLFSWASAGGDKTGICPSPLEIGTKKQKFLKSAT